MYNGKYISYESVIEQVYAKFGFNYEIQPGEAVEWLGTLMELLGAPKVLIDKIEEITIADGRGKLPCDMYMIVQTAKKEDLTTYQSGSGLMISSLETVSDLNIPSTAPSNPSNGDTYYNNNVLYYYANSTWNTFNVTSSSSGSALTPNSCEYYPMRYSGDTFHLKYHLTDLDFAPVNEYTYTVNNNFIFTNFKTGCVAMAYKGIPVDENGFPLVPDHASWRLAMEFEVAYRIAFKLWMQGKLADRKFQIIERDRDWYTAQARNEALGNMIDEEETSKNHFTRFFGKYNNTHSNFFGNMSFPEKLQNYRR